MNFLVNINIEKIKQGNKKEFEKTYFEFFDVLFAICFQYTHNKEISEGLVQDAFLKLWEVKEGLRGNTNLKNFLYTITRNNCLNILRNQQISHKHINHIKSREYYYAAEVLQNIGEDIIVFEELKSKLNNAIEELPVDLKLVFKMSRFDEMKYAEIAERLKISVKTVEAKISKSLKILRKELKDYLPLIFLISNLFS